MITVSGNQTFVVSSGQTDIGDIVLAGTLDVLSGGTVISTLVSTLNNGAGSLQLFGGVSSITTLSSNETVFSNGSALDTTVNNNAVLALGSGGFANGTIVNSGGREIVNFDAV